VHTFDIQNDLISDLATRIVVPLRKFDYFKNEKMNSLTSVITYESEELLLLIPQVASIPSSLLKNL